MASEFLVTEVNFAAKRSHPNHHIFRKKSRKEYGLTFILSGDVTMTVEGRQIRAEAGSVLLLQKDDAYQLTFSGDKPAYIVISYLAEPAQTLLSLLPDRQFATPHTQKYRDLFENVLRLWESAAICSQARLCSAVQELLCCIIQEHHRKDADAAANYAEKAMQFLEKNFALSLTCQQVAEEVGLSVSHLSQLFKKHYGASMIQVLNKIRIRQAKAMIRSGIFTLQEVAQACGFRNEYYFSRVFKQYAGTSPGKY